MQEDVHALREFAHRFLHFFFSFFVAFFSHAVWQAQPCCL